MLFLFSRVGPVPVYAQSLSTGCKGPVDAEIKETTGLVELFAERISCCDLFILFGIEVKGGTLH